MTRSLYTLLLVDRLASDRERYRRYLSADSSCTYRLLEADTAIAGLELCQTHSIDAILLDYVLPDSDGLAFIKTLHAQSDGNSPPVVMITSEGDESIAVRAIKLGATNYLVKHCLTPELLQLTLQSAIRNADGIELQLQTQEDEIYDRLRTEVDRKRNEQRLRESEERLQIGMQVAGVALARFDYASNTVALSPEAAALYGISPDHLTVTRDCIHNTFHPEERAILEQIIAQVIDPAGAGWFAREHRVVWQTGEVRWLNVRKQVFFDRSGEVPRPDYAILAAIDISERKTAEAERDRLLVEAQAAREAAEAANQSKDEFVAVVAHELRSPLNSILGWAKLLQNRKLDEATTAKALETIARNTQAQVQLIEDLLDISRMVKGTLRLNLAPVNLVEVSETALNIVRPMAEAKQIQLEMHLADRVQISGDFHRLQQIIVNLLMNAIKFTPQAGRVELQLEQFEAQAQLQICDTGKGIAAEFLPVIFDRFQQGQKNLGSKDGLGLGLAIVKNLVELHGGTISAESKGLEQGATFTIRLPILIDSLV